MPAKHKSALKAIVSRRTNKFDAATGKYKTCRLPIRDSLHGRVEVVSCPAAVVQNKVSLVIAFFT